MKKDVIKQKKYFQILWVLLAASWLFLGCTEKTKEITELESLFSFKIGYDSDDLAFFSEKLRDNNHLVYFTYKNGYYYISDSLNNKVLKITEKGSIILTLFNKNNYPHLKETIPGSEGEQEVLYVKTVRSFNLVSPGQLAVDVDKNIYVVNRDPSYKQLTDGIISDVMILKFDGRGNYLYSIGREGIDRSPFSYIVDIKTDNKDNLLVIEKIEKGGRLYKFSKTGELLTTIDLTPSFIPILKNESTYLVDFISLIPGFSENEAYVTCQFINKSQANFSIFKYETMYEKVYNFAIQKGTIEKLLLKVSPQYEDLKKYDGNPEVEALYGDRKKIMKPMETFIGLDENHYLYLVQKEIPLRSITESSHTLSIYQPNGALHRRISFEYPQNVEFYTPPVLLHDGRVVSYYIKDGEMHFVLLHSH